MLETKYMETETFIIKSLFVQNAIMLLSFGLVLFLFILSIKKNRQKSVIASLIWIGILFWFFNSSFFGFSAVSVSKEGIRLNYGILSLRNDLLPLDSSWKVENYFGGLRKMKRLHFLRIGNHESMKVRGMEDLNYLQEIGSTIDLIRAK